VIVGEADRAEIWDGRFETRKTSMTGEPLALLESLLSESRRPALPDWPAMTGGLMGVFGYDLVHTFEKFAMRAERDLRLPLYVMIETKELFVYDHERACLGIVVWCDVGQSENSIESLFAEAAHAADLAWRRWASAEDLRAQSQRAESVVKGGAESASFSPEEFRDAVRRVKNYIAAGDTYQVNLSLRTSRPIEVSAEAIYESLRAINPSPYMGLLRLPLFSLVCGSPELLVRLEDGKISSRPIAGTRPRVREAGRDSSYSAELLASDKERAEHLMLVDLIRNDIGRVAEFGSVEVREFMAVEQYSHVMHLVSQVEGRLADRQTWADVLRSMFPGGTITGCPKIRTMEIIEELEAVGRGYYTGSLGWISYGREMEMNIVIRSMLVRDGLGYVQSGAGVVADSDPARELDETLRKAHALWVALEHSSQTHV
jgi:para-aminobenzoate synthetase component 1